jgi:hypothetical protein
MMRFLLTFLTVTSFCLLLTARVHPQDGTHSERTELRTEALASEPLLQKSVSSQVVHLPLYDVFKQLSDKLPVELRVDDAHLRDQRITLAVHNQPCHILMARLVVLLSHADPVLQHQYSWIKVIRSESHAQYILMRVKEARIAEERELAKPLKEAKENLQSLRDLADNPQSEVSKDATPFIRQVQNTIAKNPQAQALRGLSNSELDRLMNGESIFISAGPLEPSLHAAYDASVQMFKERGDPRVFPDFQMPKEEFYTIQINSDWNDDKPNSPLLFMLSLTPGRSISHSIGGYHISNYYYAMKDGLLPETGKDEPVYDLTPILDDPVVTNEQRGDMGFVLDALAGETGIEIYQEFFYKGNPNLGGTSPGLRRKKGTRNQLINEICRTWGYQVQKVGDSYLFWSRVWAQDRQNDIPEKKLDEVRRTIKRAGGMTEAVTMELASKLTWGQFKATLPIAIPEAKTEITKYQFLSMHIIGLLTPQQRQIARDQGVVISQLPGEAQRTILNDLNISRMVSMLQPNLYGKLSSNDLLRCQVRLRTTRADDPNAPVDMRYLTIVSPDGKVIWYPFSI